MGTLTGTLATRAGSGSIRVIHPDLPTGNFKVFDAGSLKLTFDLESDKEDESGVFFAPNKFKFTMDTQLEDGTKLFPSFDSIPSNEFISLELDFTTDSGFSFQDDYVFKQEDINYKATQRNFEIESYIDLNPNISRSDVFDSNSGDIYEAFATPSRERMTAIDFIRNTLEYGKPNNTFVNRANVIKQDPFSTMFNGDYPYVITVTGDDYTEAGTPPTSYFPVKPVREKVVNAYEIMHRLALIDGSVIGSMFGYNFIVSRANTETVVDVSNNEVEDYELEFGSKNYRTVKFLFDRRPQLYNNTQNSDEDLDNAGFYIGGKLAGSADGLNDFGSKTLSVYIKGNEFSISKWDNASQWFIGSFSNYVSVNGEVVTDLDQFYTVAGTVDRKVKEKRSSFQYTGTGLSAGDLISFAEGSSELYVVKSAQNNKIVLWEPLESEIEEGVDVIKYEQFQPDELSPSVIVDLAQKACETYAKAYKGDGSRQLKTTIWDIDKLPPYGKIKLDTSFKEEVVHNKIFVPSELEFNLETDKINFVGYSLN